MRSYKLYNQFDVEDSWHLVFMSKTSRKSIKKRIMTWYWLTGRAVGWDGGNAITDTVGNTATGSVCHTAAVWPRKVFPASTAGRTDLQKRRRWFTGASVKLGGVFVLKLTQYQLWCWFLWRLCHYQVAEESWWSPRSPERAQMFPHLRCPLQHPKCSSTGALEVALHRLWNTIILIFISMHWVKNYL